MSRVADALKAAAAPTGAPDPVTALEHPWGGDLASVAPESWRGWSARNGGPGARPRAVVDASFLPAPHGPAADGPPRLDPASPLATLRPEVRQQIAGLVERVFFPHGAEAPHIVAFGGVDVDAQSGWITAVAADMLAHRTPARIAAVDLNFANPRLHAWFGVAHAPGVLEALSSETPLRDVATQVRPNLWLLPSGEPAGLLDMTTASRTRLARLASAFDHVLVSLEPLAGWCGGGLPVVADGVVLAVAAEASRRQTARELAERLQASGATIFGAVLTNRHYVIPEAIYRRL